MKVLSVNTSRCVGCRICEQWCSYSHHGVISPSKTRIRVLRDLEQQGDVPLVCHQCASPLCIKACPCEALYRDEKNGFVGVAGDKCTGCGLCVEACVHGAIGVDPKGCPVICDLCGGRPQCVVHCPEGALRYLRREFIDREKKLAAARGKGASAHGD